MHYGMRGFTSRSPFIRYFHRWEDITDYKAYRSRLLLSEIKQTDTVPYKSSTLRSGANLILDIGTIDNDTSLITSGGDIHFKQGTRLNNKGVALTRIYEDRFFDYKYFLCYRSQQSNRPH